MPVVEKNVKCCYRLSLIVDCQNVDSFSDSVPSKAVCREIGPAL